jgi:hypothetical protein
VDFHHGLLAETTGSIQVRGREGKMEILADLSRGESYRLPSQGEIQFIRENIYDPA